MVSVFWRTHKGEARLPFQDEYGRKSHFDKHKNEFNFASDVEYEAAADAFVNGVAVPPVREGVRPNGERVRFNRRSREFAVVAPSGFIETFHCPSDKYISLGYFEWECWRVNPRAK